jgi:UDP-glucose 4-epimerase
MKVLITGGAGFIASHLADAYLARGDEVVVVDNLVHGKRERVSPRAAFYEVDVGSPQLAEVFEVERPDLVSHHAAQMDVRKSVDDPTFDASVNILGGINLLEQCRKFGVNHVTFASTGGAIYGELEQVPAPETHPVRPISPYGASKFSFESYLFLYRYNYGLDYTILRYANVYGPRQDPHGEAGVVAIFGNLMLDGRNPTIYGDGEQVRDYVYVGDVVNANLLCGPHVSGEIFNIGTGVATSVNDLFRLMRDLIGFSHDPHNGPARLGEIAVSALDATKARRQLGWQPTTTLREGLEKTVEYLRNEPSAVNNLSTSTRNFSHKS